MIQLPPESTDRLLARCQFRRVDAGQHLFKQEEPHATSYIVESGLIRTYYTAESGREITLGYWSRGDLSGGPNFLGGGDHIWSGVVVRSGRVLAVSDIDMRQLAEQDANILRWITEQLSSKLRWLSVLFQIHATESVLHRLTKLLLLLGETYGDRKGCGVLIKHDFTQTELATLVGASRQWTNSMLGQLKREHLLEVSRKQILLLDVNRLRNLAVERRAIRTPLPG